MAFDPPAAPPNASTPAEPAAAPAGLPGINPRANQYFRESYWASEHRLWRPYWQKDDPIPPLPDTPPEIETPGEVLTDRQEAFCRAYVECPVGAKAAISAGYSPENSRRQASRLLKHPLVIRRIYTLRNVRGADHHVRRDTIIDQAEAVFEAAMEKRDFYAAMQALTMKARLAGFADYLPGVRILRRDARDHEEMFWARAHAAEQRIMAARLGEIAGAEVLEAQSDATMFADSAEAAAETLAMQEAGEAERRARAKRSGR